MNTMGNGWQGYSQGPNQQFGSAQYSSQNQYGQNGGNLMSQPTETPFVGRYINHIEEVMPREVPMDGRAALFPTQTLEEIYLKAWDRNGTIKTFRYILDPMQGLDQQGRAQESMESKILERLEKLEERLSEAQQQPKQPRRGNSKGGEDNA